MAESGGQEKTERATPKRRREARKQGQLPRSRELSTAVVVGTGSLLVAGIGSGVAAKGAALMRSTLSFDAAALDDPGRMPVILGRVLFDAMVAVSPFFVGTLLAALLAPMLIGGWNFALRAIQPDLARLNPLSGIGRMFSSHSLVELLKGVAKFVLVGMVAGLSIWNDRGELLGLGSEPTIGAVAHGLSLVTHTFVVAAGALGLIAAVDVPWQLWSFSRRMKMSRQDVRDEHKQTEGRPEVKNRIRRLQQQISRRRMMDKVPKADVVVTNPTHYAVALQYSADSMRAPKVIAKGADQIAIAIRALATYHRIPVVEAPPLARALYRGCELEQEIPGPLYAAVAQVLTYVYQLKAWNRAEIRNPRPPLQPEVGDVPGGERDSQA